MKKKPQKRNKAKKITAKIPNKIITEEIKKQLPTLRIMDDLLAKPFFRDLKCTEIVVNAILENPVKVVKSFTQHRMENTVGRASIVDVLAQTEDGKHIVIEIQRVSDEWLPLRARHICSVSDANLIKSGTKFKDIHEFYTIFIMEDDPFGRGKSVYRINRRYDDTLDIFKDRQTIIFVNGATKEEGELRDLLDDFFIGNYREMKNEIFRENMKRIKEAIEREDEDIMEFITEEMKALAQRLEERGMEKGVKKGREEGMEEGMERGMERGRAEGMEEGKKEGLFQSALNFLKMGLSVEDVARGTGLPREKIMELKASF